MTNARRAAAALLLALLAQAAAAQELVPGPEFASWARFKPGTAVVLRSTSTIAGMKSETDLTITLLAVGAEELTLETKALARVDGMRVTSPPARRVVKRMIPLPAGSKKEELGRKPAGTVEEGAQKVRVGKEEYATQWYLTRSRVADNDVETKQWRSDDVPGAVVRTDSKTTGKVAVSSRMELVEVRKP